MDLFVGNDLGRRHQQQRGFRDHFLRAHTDTIVIRIGVAVIAKPFHTSLRNIQRVAETPLQVFAIPLWVLHDCIPPASRHMD